MPVVELERMAEHTVIIAGAGIGGLTLALELKKHCGLEG